MWIQRVLLLVSSTTMLCRSSPTPAPIAVYQQSNAKEQQDYLYRPPLPHHQGLTQHARQEGSGTGKGLLHQKTKTVDEDEECDDYEMYPPQPYQFSFDVNDDENTNYQNRKEQRQGNRISGSYSVVDADGFIRTVTYTADPVEGFKAHVSREPTNIVVKVPKPASGLEESHPNLYNIRPKFQYAVTPSQHSASLQFRAQKADPGASETDRQRPLLQGAQDVIQYRPVYQAQGSLRHRQAISTAGQINQFLAETSPQAAQVSQYSNSNIQLRG